MPRKHPARRTYSPSTLWRRFFPAAARNKPCRRPQRSHQPVLEPLEERMAPAVDLTQVGPGLTGDLLTSLLVLIGDQLATEPAGQVLQAVHDRLSGFAPTTSTIDAVKTELVNRLGNLIQGGRDGIAVLGSEQGSEIRFQLTLAGSESYTGAQALNFELGLGADCPLKILANFDN